MLHFYNTLSRTKEKFKPLSQEKVKLYQCGPTPYNYAHIGNLRAYLNEDFIIRTLLFLGYRLETTMNVTDIDDKSIRDSQKQGIGLREFTEKYTALFLEDIDALGIRRADHIVPISSLVDEMVLMINRLLEKGYAYLAEDGSIYYSIRKFKPYGAFANLDIKGMKSNVRIRGDEYEKEQVADFALWKAYDAEADGPNKWEATFMIDGEPRLIPGRPGWHIECSACNLKYFGPQIDIHLGGIDNLFPHHQNEIAQSEAFSGKTFSNYWIHIGHLLVDGKKMAKSAGNFYTLRDVFARFPLENPKKVARAFRLMALATNYRENFNFTFASLESALRTLDGLDEALLRLKREKTTADKVRKSFREFLQETMAAFIGFLEDDFSTPEALAEVHAFLSDLHSIMDAGPLSDGEKRGAVDLLRSFDSVFAVFDFSLLEDLAIPPEIAELSEARLRAKADKDFALADEYRAKIESAGYRIVDAKDGTTVERRG